MNFVKQLCWGIFITKGIYSHQFQLREINDNAKSNKEEFDPTNFSADPGLRIPILDYNSNIQDDVRRTCILKLKNFGL